MVTTTVPFVISGLITTWMLNLRDFKAFLSVTVSDWYLLLVITKPDLSLSQTA